MRCRAITEQCIFFVGAVLLRETARALAWRSSFPVRVDVARVLSMFLSLRNTGHDGGTRLMRVWGTTMYAASCATAHDPHEEMVPLGKNVAGASAGAPILSGPPCLREEMAAETKRRRYEAAHEVFASQDRVVGAQRTMRSVVCLSGGRPLPSCPRPPLHTRFHTLRWPRRFGDAFMGSPPFLALCARSTGSHLGACRQACTSGRLAPQRDSTTKDKESKKTQDV